jgi:hypothetical protein
LKVAREGFAFAPEGSAEFQKDFGAAMAQLGEATKAALGSNLVALVLGGGYGRGEGGVVHTDRGDHAFNDVDLFLFVNDPSRVDMERLHSIEHEFSERVRAEVEFGPATAVDSLSRMKPAQMWFDLIHGHVVLSGDEAVTDRFSASVANTVPVYEGSRLLLNRGAGLLWARRGTCGACDLPDEDFVRRNVWKANLALRDAALILEGMYPQHWRLRADAYAKWLDKATPKSARLQRETVERAARFKVAPGDFPVIDSVDLPIREWVEAFLELESLRFGCRFPDSEAYRSYTGLREPAGDAKDRLRSLARNLKSGSLSSIERRNRLYPELPALLVQTPDDKWRSESAHWLDQWKTWC